MCTHCGLSWSFSTRTKNKIYTNKKKNHILYTITPRDPVAGNYHENTTMTLNTGGGGGGHVKSTAAGICILYK